jgi:hypothetical protein
MAVVSSCLISIALCALVGFAVTAPAAGAGSSALPVACAAYNSNRPQYGLGWQIGIFVEVGGSGCSNAGATSLTLDCLPDHYHEWEWLGNPRPHQDWTASTRSFDINTRTKVIYAVTSRSLGTAKVKAVVTRVVFTGSFARGVFTGIASIGAAPCKRTRYTATYGGVP